MTIMDKLEKEFATDSTQSTKTSYQDSPFARVLGEHDYDQLIPEDLKHEIKELVKMLDDYYNKKIAPTEATMMDAFEYMPLFCLNGALMATFMNIPYEDYLRLTEVLIVLSGIKIEGV